METWNQFQRIIVQMSDKAHGPLNVVDFEVTCKIQVAIIITKYFIYIHENDTIRFKQLSWFSHKISDLLLHHSGYVHICMILSDLCGLRTVPWDDDMWKYETPCLEVDVLYFLKVIQSLEKSTECLYSSFVCWLLVFI